MLLILTIDSQTITAEAGVEVTQTNSFVKGTLKTAIAGATTKIDVLIIGQTLFSDEPFFDVVVGGTTISANSIKTSEVTEVKTCIPCPFDKIQPEEGMSKCELCDAKTTTMKLGQTVCTTCSSGEYMKAATTGTFVFFLFLFISNCVSLIFYSFLLFFY